MKKLLAVVLSLSVLFALSFVTGCKDNKPTEPDPVPINTPGPVDVAVDNFNDCDLTNAFSELWWTDGNSGSSVSSNVTTHGDCAAVVSGTVNTNVDLGGLYYGYIGIASVITSTNVSGMDLLHIDANGTAGLYIVVILENSAGETVESTPQSADGSWNSINLNIAADFSVPAGDSHSVNDVLTDVTGVGVIIGTTDSTSGTTFTTYMYFDNLYFRDNP